MDRNRKLFHLMPDDPQPLLPAFHPEKAVAEVELRAMALWPRIAGETGLPVQGARFSVMQVNTGRQDRVAVLGLRTVDERRFVLRADFSGERAKSYRGHLDRHQDASRALQGVPGVHVPDLIWRDAEHPFALFAFVPGEKASSELTFAEYGLTDRAELLRRIGAAVAALHGAEDMGVRLFWPKPRLEQIQALGARLRAGDLRIRKPKKFLGLCAMLHRVGREAKGRAYRAAPEHGDLHFRNILVTQAQISFIDFSNAHATTPYCDIANLWLANLPDHLALRPEDAGFGGVARADWLAFESGYGEAVADNPVFRFLFLHRLLKAWLRLPPPEVPLGERDLALLTGVERVFAWLQQIPPEG